MSSEDPFPLVREEVQSLFASCQDAARARSVPQRQTLSDLDEVDMLLNDLHAAVQAVTTDPERFGLSRGEVEERGRFVEGMREESKGLRLKLLNDIRPSSSRSATTSGSRSTVPAGYSSFTGSASKDKPDQGIQMQEMAQQEIIREQDEHLEQVMGTVGTLKHVAMTMGGELHDQARLLDEVDEHVDYTHGRLRTAMAKVNKILRSDSDTKSTILIIVLTIIVLILLLSLIF